MSAIAKVPFILLVSLALHVSYTSPSRSSPDERGPVKCTTERFLAVARMLVKPIKGVFWALGVAETFAILAHTLPLSLRVGPHTASSLVRSGNPNDLYLTPLSFVGAILIISGNLLRIQCYREMKDLFTFEISIRKDHELITTGPYGVVRHPSYSGLLAVDVGVGLWYGSRGAWLREPGILETMEGKVFAAGFAVMIYGILVGVLRRVPVEDAELRRVFGRQWEEWSRSVRYALIPGVY